MLTVKEGVGVDVSDIANVPYADARAYMEELAAQGGYSARRLSTPGLVDVTRDLGGEFGVDLIGAGAEGSSERVDGWVKRFAGSSFSNVFSPSFRREIDQSGGAHDFFGGISSLMGSVFPGGIDVLQRMLGGKNNSQLTGVYYRSLLQLSDLMGSKFPERGYGAVERVSYEQCPDNYPKQLVLSIISAVVLNLLRRRSSHQERFCCPLETVRPFNSKEEMIAHCNNLLRIGLGKEDDGSEPFQEFLLMKEVEGLVGNRMRENDPNRREIEERTSSLKKFRAGCSILQSQASATCHKDSVFSPLSRFIGEVPDGGTVMGFGCGDPPFLERASAQQYPGKQFVGMDVLMEGRQEYSPNLTGLHVDLDKKLEPQLSQYGYGERSVDLGVFSNSIHKLRRSLSELIYEFIGTYSGEGGRCAVLTPAVGREDLGVWHGQLGQDTTRRALSILPMEAFLELPRVIGEQYGIRCKIASLGVLLDSEVNDMTRRLLVVYEFLPIKGLERLFRGRIAYTLRNAVLGSGKGV